MKLKAKDLRKKSEKELRKMLDDIDRELLKWNASKAMSGGESLIQLPSGVKGGTAWGIFNRMKKDRAVILTVLGEHDR